MSLRAMLPERYRSPAFWDDEAAMRAFLDDVEALAREALDAARWFDRLAEQGDRSAHEMANDLHSAAEVVVPGICDIHAGPPDRAPGEGRGDASATGEKR